MRKRIALARFHDELDIVSQRDQKAHEALIVAMRS